MVKLSKLEPVPLREVWAHEANHFTKWMAEKSNLQLLGDIVDIDLEFVECEARVGKFSLDILAKDKISGDKIIIENQLGRTDHKHLGQLITYASGHDAAALIWVVAEVNSEHRQAIEWLNKNSSESIDFYLVKIELWRIDNSKPAPRFEIVESPSSNTGHDQDSTISVVDKKKAAQLSGRKIQYLDFWNKFKQYLDDYKKNVPIQTPRAQYYCITRPGFADSEIKLMIVPSKQDIRCRIVFRNEHRAFYDFLKQNHKQVERDLEKRADWETHVRSDSILMILPVDDVYDESQQLKYFKWLANHAILFKIVFGEYHEKYQGDGDINID